jgi:3-phosphoshikimate 1-carboxyvinyltransferase
MKVYASHLNGVIDIPPSKSHTLRAILFASLAKGISQISNYLISPDTDAMIQACRAFGAEIQKHDERLVIQGVDAKPSFQETFIDAGNSGQVLRFIAAIAGLSKESIQITGDDSIQTSRPVLPILSGLKQYGCQAETVLGNDFAPIQIQGPFKTHYAKIDGQDSQPVSGLLIARAFAQEPSILEVVQPGETPWVNLTLDWLRRLGIEVTHQAFSHYEIKGRAKIKGFEYQVPGDFSSCAFPLVAAVLTQSEIILNHLDTQDVQGDKLILDTLASMGAKFEVLSDTRQIKTYPTLGLIGGVIDMNPMIDAIPILAVVGCFAKGPTTLLGGAIAKNKESNRLAVMAQELRKLGAHIEELPDGLKIYPSHLHSGVVQSHQDHRVAMALAIAGMMIPEGIEIQDDSCISKSFPQFKEKMKALGARID